MTDGTPGTGVSRRQFPPAGTPQVPGTRAIRRRSALRRAAAKGAISAGDLALEARAPFTAIEFEGMTVTPYVDTGRCQGKGKCCARQGYSLKATGVRARRAGRPARRLLARHSTSVGSARRYGIGARVDLGR